MTWREKLTGKKSDAVNFHAAWILKPLYRVGSIYSEKQGKSRTFVPSKDNTCQLIHDNLSESSLSPSPKISGNIWKPNIGTFVCLRYGKDEFLVKRNKHYTIIGQVIDIHLSVSVAVEWLDIWRASRWLQCRFQLEEQVVICYLLMVKKDKYIDKKFVIRFLYSSVELFSNWRVEETYF